MLAYVPELLHLMHGEVHFLRHMCERRFLSFHNLILLFNAPHSVEDFYDVHGEPYGAGGIRERA